MQESWRGLCLQLAAAAPVMQPLQLEQYAQQPRYLASVQQVGPAVVGRLMFPLPASSSVPVPWCALHPWTWIFL